MKKIITLALIAAIITANTSAFAAPVPRECAPYGTDEAAITVTENLISPILDSVANGEGYGSASARANTAIRRAVIADETKGYGYALLSAISQNAIRVTRDIYMRPDVYKQIEDELRVLLADIITDIQNGKDYNTAIQEAHTKIYQAVDPSYDPAVDRVGDFCYWDIPPVDNAYFIVAHRLLLQAQ